MKKSELGHLALSDNGFLFDTSSGFTFTLNSVGTHVLKEIISGKEVGEIVDDVVKYFDVDTEDAARDIKQFQFRLFELNLVNGEGR